jgi:DNA primase catalytic core
MPRVDVEALRAAHPIEQVVAASGVELKPVGRAFMARCPFHVEDRTPSLSVGGVPGRYHCFACGARGDVIDYVARFNGIDFRAAADRLAAGAPFTGLTPTPLPTPRPPTDGPIPDRTPAGRLFEINELAWRQFTTLPNVRDAAQYLSAERGIDVRAIHAAVGERLLAGYAPADWRSLTDALLNAGVRPDELIDADLAARRNQRLYDTYRGRVIVPVRDSLGRIEGFIGRDTTGDPRTAKYRNPTRTATFDKSSALYRPTRHALAANAQVIVVEGVMDALALTAAAAETGTLDLIAPVTTSGLAVSRVQAAKIIAITRNPVALALDGDDAGHAATTRWIQQLHDLGRLATTIQLPERKDPADWIAEHGPRGLAIFRRLEPALDRDSSLAMEATP